MAYIRLKVPRAERRIRENIFTFFQPLSSRHFCCNSMTVKTILQNLLKISDGDLGVVLDAHILNNQSRVERSDRN